MSVLRQKERKAKESFTSPLCTKTAEKMIAKYFNKQPLDLTEITMNHHNACRVLAMVSSQQTIICLTKAFETTSLAVPFFEPYLPFYDSVRETDAFKNMLANISK